MFTLKQNDHELWPSDLTSYKGYLLIMNNTFTNFQDLLPAKDPLPAKLVIIECKHFTFQRPQ